MCSGTFVLTFEPVNFPLYGAIFVVFNCRFLGLITFCGYSRPLCPNKTHKTYPMAQIKVHSGNSACSGKQKHRIYFLNPVAFADEPVLLINFAPMQCVRLCATSHPSQFLCLQVKHSEQDGQCAAVGLCTCVLEKTLVCAYKGHVLLIE